MDWPVRFRVREATPVRSIDVPDGTVLLDAVRSAGLPIARACGGDGLCARCAVRVLAGAAALGGERSDEAEAKRRNRVPEDLRLACRCRVRGPVEVTASYW
jgi:2Fe-2S ferredoxin